jgi:uncharacterized SAM-binding protein YcdF (DUF218 family)
VQVKERSRRHRGWKWGGGLGVFLLLSLLAVGLSSAGSIYTYQDTVDGVRLPPVDAIVVLAGGRGRIAVAGDLWNRYRELLRPGAPPVLYFSGVGPQTTFGLIQGQLRPGVTEVIRAEQVVVENESSNTEENALWLARYARERGWTRVLLVTSSYHMKRARLIFSTVLADEARRRNAMRSLDRASLQPVAVETLSVYQEPFEPGEWLTSLHGARVTLTEYLKWVYYTRFWVPKPVF